MRHAFRGFLVCFAIGSYLVTATARAADSPHYEFKDKLTVYEVTVRTEIPGAVVTYKGHIAYGLKAAGSNLDLLFKSHFDFTKEATGQAGDVPTGFEGNLVVDKPDQPLGEVIMNRYGGDRHLAVGDGRQSLPEMLGPEWAVPLLPLSPSGANTWTVNTTIITETHEGGGPVTHKMIVPSSFETTSAAGGRITFKGHQDWTSPEQLQGKPLLQAKADQTTVFDTDIGAVESMHKELKHTMVRGNGEPASISATIDAHLIKGPEADAFTVDLKDALAKYQEHLRKEQARDEMEGANVVSTVPPGMAPTQTVGIDGGSPYIRVDHAHRPMIGMSIRLGQWGGHPILRHVQPIYDAPADLHLEETEFCLAKEGYVVGGIVVSKKESIDGLQVIFVKSTPKGLDPKDTYRSQWFGDDSGEQIQIAGNGERVVGIVGRQGLNNDRIGLLLDVHDDPKAAEMARIARLHQAAQDDGLAPGLLETELVGGEGGGPYVRVDADRRPVVGFRIKIGSWDHATLGNVQPLFEPPADKPTEKNLFLCIARPGYVVGGITVHKDSNADGMRVIFMKLDGDRLDPKQSYTSPWYGFTGKGKNVQLLGTGEKVVGTVGHQGLNNDALGLVYEEKQSAGPSAAPK